jgi:hypothetical protein
VAETTRDVFFYGLFMDEELLRAKGANPQAPRKAVVSGRRLRIGQRAMLVPDAAARAYGMVFALTDRELEVLYAEPGLDLYTAERVVATYEDGTSRAVTTYNLAQAMATGPSNQEYAARLRSVLERLGFPTDDAAPMP